MTQLSDNAAQRLPLESLAPNLERFASNFQYRMKLLSDTRVHTDRLLATRYNVFDYIRPNENRLSDIIRDLLDPNGFHGQGDNFLREFITVTCAHPPTWTSCRLHRENTTSLIENHLRRIDVLIDFGKFGIAIENKPWAGDQEDQIGDYVKHLERRFAGRFVIVYLSASGSRPTSINAPAAQQLLRAKRLVLTAYPGHFRGWLMNCYKNCAAEKVRWFLLDFVAYIDATFALQTSVENNTDDDED